MIFLKKVAIGVLAALALVTVLAVGNVHKGEASSSNAKSNVQAIIWPLSTTATTQG
jgi:hypothetical protein